MENISKLKEILSMPKVITILSHRNPDGDALGSSLGLYHYLMGEGHTVNVAFPSDFPGIFSWMKDSDKALIFDLDPEETTSKIKGSDIIFCLDFNALDRIDKMGEVVLEMDVPKVMIDHHLYPEGCADFMLSDTSASSTSELVFDFISLIDKKQKITRTIGECLFTGIVTDTGSFRYATSAKLFRIVADLVDAGVDDYDLQNRIHNSLPEKNIRLLGHCLNNRMEIWPELSAGIITLTKDDYEKFDISRGDTEGIVNYLLMMKKIKVAAFITEQPTIVKLSLRSKGDLNMQKIAKKYFRGGGHKNASGGASFKGLRTTVNTFKKALIEIQDQLNA